MFDVLNLIKESTPFLDLNIIFGIVNNASIDFQTKRLENGLDCRHRTFGKGPRPRQLSARAAGTVEMRNCVNDNWDN